MYCMFCFFSMWKLIFRRAECSKVYLKPVETFFGSLRSVLYFWLWKFECQTSLCCVLQAVHTFNTPVSVPHLWRGGNTTPSPQVLTDKSDSWLFIRSQGDAMRKTSITCIILCTAQVLSSVQETGPQWTAKTKKCCVDAQRASVQLCS